MTEQERNRQQWKALRAPVIQRAWDGRNTIRALRLQGLSYQRFRSGHIQLWDGTAKEIPFGDSLNLLTTMRAAEKAGENALMWKLTHG